MGDKVESGREREERRFDCKEEEEEEGGESKEAKEQRQSGRK